MPGGWPSQNFQTDALPLTVTDDPNPVQNVGWIYSKLVGGISELFLRRNNGTIAQLTGGTGIIVHSHENPTQGGQLDHGLAMIAASLLDDDHPQYALADKSRPTPWVGAADLSPRSVADLGTRDHDLLTGLLDDDHTQYALANKTRPVVWVEAADLSPRSVADLGTRDHDLLTGLLDDDHTQYALANKTRPVVWVEAGDLTPRSIADLGTRTHALLTGLAADDHPQYLLRSVATTKGDIFVATGAATVVRLGVGADGQVLTADSAQAEGVRWVSAGGAPSSAQYLVLALNGTLTDERVFTAGSGLSFVDGGPGGAYTVANTLRTGLSGGQTVVGGTAASENLTLQSTSDATRGSVIAADKLLTTATATLAPILLGSIAGDPAAPVNGDLWYNSTTNKLRGRENGASFDLVQTGFAPVGAQYLVLVADGTLTDERVFTAGAGIAVTDGGAGGAYTVANTLRTGLSGGQTVVGGTGAGEGLTLSSTSHGTKGSIIFGTSSYDEVNNRLGIGVAPGAFRLNVAGDTRIDGKLTVTGSIDPTDITLSGGGTAHWQQWGAGSTAPVSAASTGRIRYNESTNQFEASVNGAAYAALGGGVTGSGENTRVAFWTGTSTLSSDADMVYDSTNNRLTVPVMNVTSSNPSPVNGDIWTESPFLRWHLGGVTRDAVDTSTNQTIDGQKTFSALIWSAAASADAPIQFASSTDPAAAGQLGRSAGLLRFHDGTAIRTAVLDGPNQTIGGQKTFTALQWSTTPVVANAPIALHTTVSVPTSAGEFGRSGSNLIFHDGTQNRNVMLAGSSANGVKSAIFTLSGTGTGTQGTGAIGFTPRAAIMIARIRVSDPGQPPDGYYVCQAIITGTGSNAKAVVVGVGGGSVAVKTGSDADAAAGIATALDSTTFQRELDVTAFGASGINFAWTTGVTSFTGYLLVIGD